MRLTMDELRVETVGRPQTGLRVEFLDVSPVLAVAIQQPADPFCGQGDFEYHPAVLALMLEQRRSQLLEAQVAAADVALKNVEAILDRPLSKLKVKDLKILIGAAQDAVADAKEQMG